MTPKPVLRRAVRNTRPDSQRFIRLMLVYRHWTFRWSIASNTIVRAAIIAFGIWAIAVTGSAWGLWATKKLMSFSHLQEETAEQQRQLEESQQQAQALEQEITSLRSQMEALVHSLDPKAPGTDLPTIPTPQNPGKGPSAEKMRLLKRDLDQAIHASRVIRSRMEPIFYTWNHTPSIPPTAGNQSSGYGIRLSPFSRAGESEDGLVGWHTGIDIRNVEGTPIQATAAGKVVHAGWMEGYGWAVVIRHTDELETLYAHLSHIHVVLNQPIQRADIIGYMGQSGRATGVHLHYEVRRNGRPVNPNPYLRLQRQFLRTRG